MKNTFKKFLGNKNTVTILGVVLIVAILGIGYHVRINQKTSLKSVPVAKETIAPKTQITDSMIRTVSVPTNFLVGSYYENPGNIIGKYTNYNATIAEGSLFYVDLLVNKEDLPDLMFGDIEEGYRPFVIDLGAVTGLYGGPGDYIDIYFSGITADEKVMFGQFLNGIQILSIVDDNGRNAYTNSSDEEEEQNAAQLMYISVPEDLYIMLNRYDRLNEVVSTLKSHLVLTPHSVDPDVENVDIYLTSDDIRKLINDNSKEIDKIEEKIEKAKDEG